MLSCFETVNWWKEIIKSKRFFVLLQVWETNMLPRSLISKDLITFREAFKIKLNNFWFTSPPFLFLTNKYQTLKKNSETIPYLGHFLKASLIPGTALSGACPSGRGPRSAKSSKSNCPGLMASPSVIITVEFYEMVIFCITRGMNTQDHWVHHHTSLSWWIILVDCISGS